MVTIRKINPLPSTHRDPDFQSLHRLVDAYNHELIGGPEWDSDPAADLELGHRTAHLAERHRWFAELDGQPVGYANLRIDLRDAPDVGNALIYVLPEHRRRGIGSQLLATLNGFVSERGLRKLVAWMDTPVPTGETVSPAHGVGAVPADHDGIKMALRDGYKLGQVERVSRYDFTKPLVDPQEAFAQAKAKAGDDYEIVTWIGPAPDELLDDIARLKERMTRDVPSGDLEMTEQHWDADRVRETDEQYGSSFKFYRAVARHVPTGTLVGLNDLVRDKSNDKAFVEQWDTVVLAAHRGHRLGMLVKAANILQVREAEPTAKSIITWNAEENRHMLAVNEALGFHEFMREAAFEKPL